MDCTIDSQFCLPVAPGTRRWSRLLSRPIGSCWRWRYCENARFLDAGVAGRVARWTREAEGERRLARAGKGCEGGGCWLEKGELMPAEDGGRQATKASMSQNVDRERRVPLPLIHGFVDNCASPGGRSCCPEHVEMITVRCDSPRTVRVPQFPSATAETCYEAVQPPPVPLISANHFLARGL